MLRAEEDSLELRQADIVVGSVGLKAHKRTCPAYLLVVTKML